VCVFQRSWPPGPSQTGHVFRSTPVDATEAATDRLLTAAGFLLSLPNKRLIDSLEDALWTEP
jgi:hypothetical protein